MKLRGLALAFNDGIIVLEPKSKGCIFGWIVTVLTPGIGAD